MHQYSIGQEETIQYERDTHYEDSVNKVSTQRQELQHWAHGNAQTGPPMNRSHVTLEDETYIHIQIRVQ